MLLQAWEKWTIQTQKMILDETYRTDNPQFVPGEYVMLTVKDNGCGMDKETRSHLFEPFFTTKGVGEGTGLGLATVYGIVKQNNGFIHVDSDPGSGTSFEIYLPRHVVLTESTPPKSTSELPPQGHETILLVEDEPAILNMEKLMLEKFGYRILTAARPSQALHVAKAHTGRIHLLITDMILPEMDGRDLAKSLISLNPELKCLFTSGYTDAIIARYGKSGEEFNFIQKTVFQAVPGGQGARGSRSEPELMRTPLFPEAFSLFEAFLLPFTICLRARPSQDQSIPSTSTSGRGGLRVGPAPPPLPSQASPSAWLRTFPLTCLLLWLTWEEDEPEPEVPVAAAGVDPVAARRPADPGRAVPGTAPQNPERALSRTFGIYNLIFVSIGSVPIFAPFPYIAVHVIKPPGIGRFLCNGVGFTLRILSKPSVGGQSGVLIAKMVSASGAGATGILPFGFRGQPEANPRNIPVHAPDKFLGIFPGDSLHRTTRPATLEV